MRAIRTVSALLAAALLAGCVVGQATPPTSKVLMAVEEQKKDVARLRDRGDISYEEAARRQFAIQRNNYALTEGENSFWRASILYARKVDRREISPDEYRRLVAEAYQRYVETKPG